MPTLLGYVGDDEWEMAEFDTLRLKLMMPGHYFSETSSGVILGFKECKKRDGGNKPFHYASPETSVLRWQVGDSLGSIFKSVETKVGCESVVYLGSMFSKPKVNVPWQGSASTLIGLKQEKKVYSTPNMKNKKNEGWSSLTSAFLNKLLIPLKKTHTLRRM